ncbi:MAG: sigma 54-interacting transcriptional regulator [Labilithrix sp.]|nr:sigma 54-interacting transcriptional regulator [Labilithrix sp.]
MADIHDAGLGQSDGAVLGTARRPRRERPNGGARPVFDLCVIEGPDQGVTFTVDPSVTSRVLLGRSPTCTARLSDPALAARHCSFELVGGQLRVVDLASGTRVNGVLTTEAFLVGGEVVRVGDTVLEVTVGGTRPAAPRAASFGRVLGESAAMTALHPILAELARSSAPVLIEGERGSGKRLVAEELVRLGGDRGAARDERPFVVAERGLAPDALAAALFEPGGLFDRARGGALFIAEIDDLDDAGRRTLAASIASRPDVRVMAATRGAATPGDRDPALFFTRLRLPPLRERDGDVPVLARRFWAELGGHGRMPDDFVPRLVEHRWPGNVRELKIAVQDRILHGADDASVDVAATLAARQVPATTAEPDPLDKVIDGDLPFVRARGEVVAEFERRYVERALERSGRNVARAAAASGIAHRYFQVLKARRRP